MIRGKIRSVCFVCESIRNILSCWGTTMDLKTNKKVHHNFGTTGESYTGYDSYSRLETTRVRLIRHPYKKSYSIRYMGLFIDTFFEIYYSIQYRTLTHTWHINISYSSVRLSAFVIMWHSKKRSNVSTCWKRLVGGGFMEGDLCSFLFWAGRQNIRRKKKRICKRNLNIEGDKERSKYCAFCSWVYKKRCKLSVILWVCWRSWIFLINYFTKNLDSIKKHHIILNM